MPHLSEELELPYYKILTPNALLSKRIAFPQELLHTQLNYLSGLQP